MTDTKLYSWRNRSNLATRYQIRSYTDPHPTSAWTSHQLREAFAYDCAPKYLIFDRASNFDGAVIDTIKGFGIQLKRTSATATQNSPNFTAN